MRYIEQLDIALDGRTTCLDFPSFVLDMPFFYFPNLGLIEDDSEERRERVPTITIHNQVDDEDAIMLKGAENKQAAGGGLRALRYLRK